MNNLRKRNKILFAIESFHDGGAEMFAIRLANEMSKHHHIIFMELFPYYSKEKNQKKLLRSDRIEIMQAGKNIWGRLLHNSNSKSKIRKLLFRSYNEAKKKKVAEIIQKNKVEIVHSHTWKTDIFFSELKSALNFKFISSLHGHYEHLRKCVNNFDCITMNAVQQIDKFVYLSEAHSITLNYFGVAAEKRAKIFYGLNEVKLDRNSADVNSNKILKFIFIARGIPEKGWKETIDAFKNLIAKHPGKLQLHLIGISRYVQELKKVNESNDILFWGYQQNVIPLIMKCDIGLLPSYFSGESLPNVIIEYLSCHKPVIATKVGAVEEMLSYKGEIAGTLIDLESGKPGTTALEIAIEKYINDPSLTKKHSAIAKKAAKKFNMQTCVNEYLNLYEDLLSSSV